MRRFILVATLGTLATLGAAVGSAHAASPNPNVYSWSPYTLMDAGRPGYFGDAQPALTEGRSAYIENGQRSDRTANPNVYSWSPYTIAPWTE